MGNPERVLAVKDGKKYRDRLLRGAGDLEGAKPIPIPPKPQELAAVADKWLHDHRAQGTDDNGLVKQYTAWEVAKANAVAENETRLRGVLWCYRGLRDLFAVKRTDSELSFAGKRVRDFLQKHWGVSDPPMDRIECNTLALRLARQEEP